MAKVDQRSKFGEPGEEIDSAEIFSSWDSGAQLGQVFLILFHFLSHFLDPRNVFLAPRYVFLVPRS